MIAKLFAAAYNLFSFSGNDSRPSVEEYIKELERLRAEVIAQQTKLNHVKDNKIKRRKKLSWKICQIHEKKLDKTPLSGLHAKRNVVDAELNDISTQLTLVNEQITTITSKITEFHARITSSVLTLVDKVDVDATLMADLEKTLAPTRLALE